MEFKDVYISYYKKDEFLARLLRDSLNEKGISVFLTKDNCTAGQNLVEIIYESIRCSKVFIPIITVDSIHSDGVWNEVDLAYSFAQERDKYIYSVVFGDIKEIFSERLVSYYLSRYQIFNVKESDKDWSQKAADQIARILFGEERKELLYKQIVELGKGSDEITLTRTICELVGIITGELKDTIDINKRLALLRGLEQLYERLSRIFLGYGDKEKETAKYVLDTMKNAQSVRVLERYNHKKVYASAIFLRLMFYEHIIKNDAVDTWTHGDYETGKNEAFPESSYFELQKPYRECMEDKFSDLEKYTEDEIEYINDSKRFLILPQGKPIVHEKKVYTGEAEDKYHAIAQYVQQGNHLFEMIGNDRRSSEFFNCVLTSYERLKNYCLEIGAKKLYGECVLKTNELKQVITRMEKDGESFPEDEKRIKTLLGLTIPQSGQYDAFISYKHYDFDLAEKVDNYLHRNLREVFFDKKTLPELSKSDYEHAVISALSNSKHFIVIVSDLSVLESSELEEGDWVRREMRVFNSEIQEGRKKGSNFVILATNNVYDEIMEKNKENIDIFWRWQEIIRFNDFESVLAKYIN